MDLVESKHESVEICAGHFARLFGNSATRSGRLSKRKTGILLLTSTSNYRLAHFNEIIQLLAKRNFVVLIDDLQISSINSITPSDYSEEDVSRAKSHLNCSLKFLRSKYNVMSIGVIGYGFSAKILLENLSNFESIDAAVSLYPMSTSSDDIRGITVPTLIISEERNRRLVEENMNRCEVDLRGFFTSELPTFDKIFSKDSVQMKEMNRWISIHLPSNGGTWQIGRILKKIPVEDDWWGEIGRSGQPVFINVGFKLWENGRKKWRQKFFPRPIPPPPPSYSTVVEAGGMCRSYELPYNVSLVDMVRMLSDQWEIYEDN